MNDKLLEKVMQKYSCATIEELEKKRQDLIRQIETATGIGAFSNWTGDHEGYTKINTHIGEWEPQLSEIENALRDAES
jgi:hypothetical protein